MANVISAANINADDVREIMDTDLSDARINAFINLAYRMIQRIDGELGDCGGDDTFDAIHVLVTCHLITSNEQVVATEKIGDTSVTYHAAAKGTGLNATFYGQQAIDMDCSGMLSSANKPKVSLEAVTYSDF
ncbi:MAG: hypothetical protein B5M51_00795 [Anaerolinea sp. 4484_236]|nr:MAG: hypothetical protein B5M51_00795 [Anaerolinea sp. 4484_236]